MNQPGAVSKDRPITAGRLLAELRPYRRLLWIGLVCLVLAAPASLFHPLVWMFVVDDVLLADQIQLLVPALLVMVTVQGAGIVLGAIRDRFFERAGQMFVRDLRNRVYRKINRQSVSYLHGQRTGDLMSRVISDIDNLQGALIGGVGMVLQELVTFIGVFTAVCLINWRVGLVTLIPLALVYLIVSLFNVRLKAIYRRARELLGRVSARLQDSLSGFLVIKAFSQEEREERDFAATTERHFQKLMEGVRLRTIVIPGVFFLGFTTNVIMLGLGAWFVYRGEFTIGGLIAFRGYWWQLNSPIRTIAQVNDILQRALAAAHRVYEVLDAPVDLADRPDARNLVSARSPIRFQSVSFGYTEKKPVFEGLDLTIEPGERLGLAGTSGAGKSTLLYLLARFYDPVSGSIRIGDQDLRSLRQGDWRRHLAMVLQDTFLFSGSVADNIRYGDPDADDEAVVQAARRANADLFVRDLPDGYASLVGERGVKLSGGQRQRIGVARAFLANPQILLLDEPTSSVEPESEDIIQQSLFGLMEGRTVVLTSHRPSLLMRSSRIVLLDRGRIAEEGTQESLMARNGTYARMFTAWQASVAAG